MEGKSVFTDIPYLAARRTRRSFPTWFRSPTRSANPGPRPGRRHRWPSDLWPAYDLAILYERADEPYDAAASIPAILTLMATISGGHPAELRIVF